MGQSTVSSAVLDEEHARVAPPRGRTAARARQRWRAAACISFSLL
jgi:hypothetical protein